MSKGEVTRQAVIDRAVEIAGRLGVAGLTIGSLASASEMSKSGLYAHFRSKEALQLAVLGSARERFVDQVIRPALAAPRGEPRVRTLFERWLVTSSSGSAGCLFVSAATEFDDQPGPVRDQVVRDHWDLVESLAQVYRSGVKEGAFREDLAPEQFAHDLHGLMLAHFHAFRLLRDPAAETRTRFAFERLMRSLQPDD
ncbi:TetR family transcriptional regulator [Cellulomonas chitinilytica]|uniref:TetR family transcriptional regulator n=1 Tax=Cellulomonas chitinilytica TaxID=398759 RepID=A0A919P3K5_9CELL|nr:TetR/AcrR family transcriptional regulator [Cellulomonas chitinilytica]GIG22593.1 TetR family transcriptional regulator [Cellulomonas chitinilytica]